MTLRGEYSSSAPSFRVLVTGAGGQLGRELVGWKAKGLTIIGFDRSQLDITDLASCREAVATCKPHAVIHCAAYTAVDRAEQEPEDAYRVNAAGSRNIALAAAEHNAKFIYVSTDYVFEGQSERPYREMEGVNPQTEYGRSKLAGEQLVQMVNDKVYVVRTSWVYGPFGGNFVQTMLKLADEKEEISVVSDQLGSPTYTWDLASFLLELVRSEAYGIYHASNSGVVSWYSFAKAIMEETGKAVRVKPCTSAEFERPAKRPAYSVLDNHALRAEGFQPLPPWRDSLRSCLRRMGIPVREE